MIPQALLVAATDPELRSRDLAVYIFLHGQLDYFTYRHLKQEWLARQLNLDRTTLAHSFVRLVKGGYLEPATKGPKHGPGKATRYRLPASPIPTDST